MEVARVSLHQREDGVSMHSLTAVIKRYFTCMSL